jgi:hypothetical protein
MLKVREEETFDFSEATNSLDILRKIVSLDVKGLFGVRFGLGRR